MVSNHLQSFVRRLIMSTNTSTKIIAVGNPGAGKSSVLNSLSGENLFKSGLSIGKGLTYQLDERVNGNGHFLDTPGITSLESDLGLSFDS